MPLPADEEHSPPELAVEVSGWRARAARLRISGELDIATAPMLLEAVTALGREVALVELDCCEVSFIDARGISAILSVQQLVGGVGHLVVSDHSPIVGRVLEMCELGYLIRATAEPGLADQ